MKRIILFFFVLFLSIQASTQSTNNWKIDLDTLEQHLLKQTHLFNSFSKTQFVKEINQLKNTNFKDVEEQFWQINEILKKFKNPNIKIVKSTFKKFPFKVKMFKNQYYITSIDGNFTRFLGCKLEKINGFPIQNIHKKTRDIAFINVKSFLEFYKFSKNDTIKLSLIDNKNKKQLINLVFNEQYDLEEMTKIFPKKKPFYLEKKQRWFWQYGINYGQQVYFKYNIGLSREFIKQQIDSMGISEYVFAKKYNLPLQSVYDAPTFIPFTEKLFLKFKKRRYKKLFIDFRNNQIGNTLAFQDFIKKLKKIKRINSKKRLFIFIDKNVSSSVIQTILNLKKETKATIIGEKITGIACSTDKIESFYLPFSEFKVLYPSQNFIPITIQPEIEVEYTFEQFKNGVDPILQRALN